ncbi:hypothetical protein MVEG_12367 [Podila verticillata NRRL 6337]|uniref:Heterokaryon incompatibility domain-containing protein n=1 Tax=Podila verticillata NRRL 6337 TaxID=1069443 RepID=A0A086TIK7_9FUNG|nr:hypothetical protein MVEG_12367 [Podila verticillata NRRL 6337]
MVDVIRVVYYSILQQICAMDILFSNRLFYLIHVDVNDKISLVKPFGNAEMQKDIQEEGYRCISHVWGTADRTVDYVWKKGEDDECGANYHRIEGITWDVETRIEKRERLLQIFKYHGGYFWMDNLCIDQSKGPEDKPLEIMGDIYAKCKECICMLDYRPISNERERIEELLENLTEERIANFPGKHEDSDMFNHISNMAKCQWFTRMWTIQEAVLSPVMLFTSETSDGFEYAPIDRSLLQFSYERTGWMKDKHGASPDILDKLESVFYGIWYLSGSMKTLMITLQGHGRECSDSLDYVRAVSGMFRVDIPKDSTIKNIRSRMIFQLWKRGVYMMDKSGIEKWGNSREVYERWSICEYGNVIGSADCLDMDRVNYGRISSKKVLVKTGEKLVKNFSEAGLYNGLVHPRGSKDIMPVHDFIKEQISIIRRIFGVIPVDVDIDRMTEYIVSRFYNGIFTKDEMEYHVEGSMIGIRTFLSAFFYVWKAENADNGECGIFHDPDELYVYKTDKVDMISKRDIGLQVGDELVMGEFGSTYHRGISYEESRDSTVFYVADNGVLSIGRVNRREEGIVLHEGTYQRPTWGDNVYPSKGVNNEESWEMRIGDGNESSGDDDSDSSYESSNEDSDEIRF